MKKDIINCINIYDVFFDEKLEKILTWIDIFQNVKNVKEIEEELVSFVKDIYYSQTVQLLMENKITISKIITQSFFKNFLNSENKNTYINNLDFVQSFSILFFILESTRHSYGDFTGLINSIQKGIVLDILKRIKFIRDKFFDNYNLILSCIQKNVDIYCKKYDFEKYPAEIYERAKKLFSNKEKNIDFKIFEEILLWKYGKLNYKNYPESHKKIIKKIYENWKSYCNLDLDYKSTFCFWDKLLPSTSFITKAFLTHLIYPNEIPIIDQHNFRCLNFINSYLCDNYKKKSKPSQFEDLMLLKSFMDRVSKELQIDKLKLDKFMMMCGKEINKKNVKKNLFKECLIKEKNEKIT